MNMLMKSFLLLLVVSSPVLAGSPRKITAAWIGPLSGPVAILGTDNLKAIRLAIKENQASANPVGLELVTEDDQYNAQSTVIQFRRLRKEKDVRLFWISNYSAMSKLAAEEAVKGVTIVNPIDNDDSLTALKAPFLLVAKRTEDLAALIARDIAIAKISEACIFYFKDDDFMPRLASILASQLDDARVKTVSEGYDKTAINFRPLFLKEDRKQCGAFVTLGYREMAEIVTQARASGIKQKFYMPNFNDAMMKLPAGVSANIRFTQFTEAEGNLARTKELMANFKREYGATPVLGWTAIQAYDSAQLVLSALSKNQSAGFPEYSTFLDWVRKFQPFEGVSGKIIVKEDGRTSGINWQLYEWNGTTAARVN